MSTTESGFGWLGGLVRGLLVVAVGVGLLVYGPHLILTRLTSVGRSPRVAIATTWFAVWFVILAVGLRRLQARRLL